ncbi:efflux RND transporter permease subunit [Escherichia coli]|nr:efflux RND transporter permease subunit [Escherichia coli]
MGGLPGRLLREFAVTLSVAIGYFVAGFLFDINANDVWLDAGQRRPREQKATAWFWPHVGSPATRLRQVTELGAQSYPAWWAWLLLGTIALNIWLYISIPKTFFPGAGHWRVGWAGFQAGSEYFRFRRCAAKLQDFMKIIRDDPAVDNVTTALRPGGSRVSAVGRCLSPSKPRDERSETAQPNYRPSARKSGAKEPRANLCP